MNTKKLFICKYLSFFTYTVTPINMKHLKPLRVTLLILLFVCDGVLFAQEALERSAPFSAVKWDGETPIVLIDDWYTLTAVNGVPVKDIVAFSKKKRKSSWQKYFSEDIIEAMNGLGKPLQVTTTLSFINDGKSVAKSVEVTKEKRRSVREYNKENPIPTTSTKSVQTKESVPAEQERIVADIQKSIAGFANAKSDVAYKFKSAKIEFTTTGHKLYAGKETYYIDDYGKTVVIVADKPGAYEPENTTMIWKDGKTTMLNHLTKKYYTTPIRTKSSEPPTIAYSNETQRKQGGYSKKANTKVAGHECEVYELAKMKVTYYLWKGIDLKIENYSLGGDIGYIREATSVEENISIPASLYTIPAGYKK